MQLTRTLNTHTERNNTKKEQCMDRIQYNILKEKYGKVASWLIYDEDYGNYEKNFRICLAKFFLLA